MVETKVKVFELDSIPLKEVVFHRKNTVVYSSNGDGLLIDIDEGNKIGFKAIHDSVLHPGNSLEGLTELQLKLFWNLSRYERSKKMVVNKYW